MIRRENKQTKKSIKPIFGSLKRLRKLTNFQLEWPRERREKTQITKIMSDREDITTGLQK